MTHKRALIVSPVANMPARSGNSTRVNDIATIMKNAGCEVHFCLVSLPIIEPRLEQNTMDTYWDNKATYINTPLNFRGTKAVRALRFIKKILNKLKLVDAPFLRRVMDFDLPEAYISKNMQAQFSQTVAKLSPDIIVFEYAVLAPLTKVLPPHIKTICDSHDCFTDRNSRLRAQGINTPWVNMLRQQEKSLLNAFDAIFAIQHHEQKMLSNIVDSETPVITLDIISEVKVVDTAFPQELNIGYIGSNNPQNLKGIITFIETCWPDIIKQYPHAKLIIAGTICPHITNEITLPESVVSLGLVDKLSDFYRQVQLIINPCIGGTGLKIKTLEAFMFEKSVVSTRDGAEGLESFEKFGLWIEENVDQHFSDSVINALENVEDLKVQSQNNIKLLNTIYQKNLTTVKELII